MATSPRPLPGGRGFASFPGTEPPLPDPRAMVERARRERERGRERGKASSCADESRRGTAVLCSRPVGDPPRPRAGALPWRQFLVALFARSSSSFSRFPSPRTTGASCPDTRRGSQATSSPITRRTSGPRMQDPLTGCPAGRSSRYPTPTDYTRRARHGFQEKNWALVGFSSGKSPAGKSDNQRAPVRIRSPAMTLGPHAA